MKRREKKEADLRHLESEFYHRLITALRTCANGYGGLFGGYDAYVQGPNRVLSPKEPEFVESREILELGERIAELRELLGYTEPFTLYQRLLEYRRLRGPNDPGEPKLAVQFLSEIDQRQIVPNFVVSPPASGAGTVAEPLCFGAAFDGTRVYFVQCRVAEMRESLLAALDIGSCFICSVVVSEPLTDVGTLRHFIKALLERGAKYLLFGGPSSERLHDLADQLRDQMFVSDDDSIIFTTWDTESKVADVAFDFLYATPANAYIETLTARIMFSTDATISAVLQVGIVDPSIL